MPTSFRSGVGSEPKGGTGPGANQHGDQLKTSFWRPVNGVPSPLQSVLTPWPNGWRINAEDSWLKVATGRSQRTNTVVSLADQASAIHLHAAVIST